ncbi:MAG: DUF1211 domain-containing protein [Actinobacteria bacterium]|nr:DUF1211 domain-containing protein [Actinomycetota bacterium]
MGTGRLETFADGVFAIAITLLVLEIPHPEVDEHLGSELVDQWPAYLAYVLSFVTIGIIWVNHHALMVQFARADRAFLFINVFFLMCVAFIPFPTALIADDLGSETAMVTYGLTLSATALMFNVFWHYGRLRLLRADADPREVRGITRSYIPGVFIYAGATAVSSWNAEVGFIIYSVLAAVYVVSGSLWAGRDAD